MTREILDTASELGVNFIDTAAVYGDGESEAYFGEALRGRRDQFIVATKTYLNDRGTATVAQHLRDRLEQSLKKLETDYVDLFQIHRADPSVPSEEVMLGLAGLVELGMVRAVGCSNYASWRLVESNMVAKTVDAPGFISIQREYSLLNRGAESELAGACEHAGVALIPYFPLASGLLWRGEMTGNERFKLGPTAKPGHILRTKDLLADLSQFARDRQHSLGELAIAWLCAKEVVGPVITGVRSSEQLRANARASTWLLSPEEMTEINEISSTGDEVRADDPFGRLSAPIAKPS